MTRVSAAGRPLTRRTYATTLRSNRPACDRKSSSTAGPRRLRGQHPKLAIAAGQIEIGGEARPPRAVQQRVNVRQRLDIRPLAGRVEAPVVVADAPRPVRRGSASSPSGRRFVGRDRGIHLELQAALLRHGSTPCTSRGSGRCRHPFRMRNRQGAAKRVTQAEVGRHRRRRRGSASLTQPTLIHCEGATANVPLLNSACGNQARKTFPLVKVWAG